ncbi:hypothetical protein COO60DRAFT_126418 [Scenedesmus sp. NREL 46B-D3]|nr:hypothetical protein COO60DRAFT_126418 [Scenedesmus sp. NREL 46B-D3]
MISGRAVVCWRSAPKLRGATYHLHYRRAQLFAADIRQRFHSTSSFAHVAAAALRHHMSGSSRTWTPLLLLVAYSSLSACYSVVPLPDGVRPEGVTAGNDRDLWVACLSGAVVHVDLVSNTSCIVHREPGVALSGAKFCPQQQAVIAAGSLSGRVFIFHVHKASSGSSSSEGQQKQQYVVTKKEVVQLAKPALSYINDVALSTDRAYFTDSFRAVIYSIPRFAAEASAAESSSSNSRNGSSDAARSRPVLRHSTGGYFATELGQFRANGLAVYASSESADTLLVANTHTGNMYSVVVPKAAATAAASKNGSISSSSSSGSGNRSSQPRAAAAGHGLLGQLLLHGQQGPPAVVRELALPTILGGKTSDRLLLDGVWVSNSSMAYVADNYNNRVWGLAVNASAMGVELSCLFEQPVLGVPTTLTLQQGLLWAVNAHLDTCFPFLPCPNHKFEVIGIDIEEECKPWPRLSSNS